MKREASKFIPLGKILQEWGIRGQAKFLSFNSQSSIYSQLKQIYFQEADQLIPLTLEASKVHGKYWLLKFQGYETPEKVRNELRGKVLGLPREKIPSTDEGELYVADLEGCLVFSHEGEEVGEIIGFQLVGETEVMKIQRADGGEVLIPYHSDFVESTSIPEKKIFLKDLAKDLLS